MAGYPRKWGQRPALLRLMILGDFSPRSTGCIAMGHTVCKEITVTDRTWQNTVAHLVATRIEEAEKGPLAALTAYIFRISQECHHGLWVKPEPFSQSPAMASKALVAKSLDAFNTAKCEKLQKEKEALERRFEEELRRLGWQQQAEVQELRERLQQQFQAESSRLRAEHQDQLLRMRCQHQEQVEDITASHEAALLEMENNHTVAITILQDDHDHKVQGIYEPLCRRPKWPC
ncbi:hypothetical protein U0070_025123 [Myodes glareolus]|uniref:Uncharacterized protein n=1 Tax=Myodes glareolus TaxID=447135 RepID=A0AAW0I8B4_MYOGA